MSKAPTDNDRLNGKILSSLGRHGRSWLMLAIAAPLIGGALLVWQAWLMSQLLGGAIQHGLPVESFTSSILLILALLLVRAALGAAGERAGTAAAEAIKSRLRGLLFAQLLAKSPREADQAQSGAASSAIIDQVEAIDAFFARYMPAMVQASVLPIAFGAIIVPLDWLAGLLFLVTAPLIPLFMALVGWGAQNATNRQARALSLLTGRFADRLRGITTLKLFGRAEAETASIVAASDELRVRTLRVLRIAFLSSAVLEFFAALGVAGVALYVGLTFIDFLHLRSTEMTLALGMFLLLMAPEVYNPLRLLASHYHDRAAAKAAIGEIVEQLGGVPDAPAAIADAVAVENTGAIALSGTNLTLRTPDNARVILNGAALNLPAGQHMALVGQSGIGKSTLLESIARIRHYEGDISLDGRALNEWSEDELRSRVTMLGQKSRIFAGSIADNIALARPGASLEAIRHAAELAHVTSFADPLPEGLDTPLGDGGLGLSGGQAQRIALARIYLRDPGLLLLDEPTAHLDAELEQEVLENLKRFARGRTMIVATHSLAVAAHMDKAYCIAGETIVAMPVPARGSRSVA
jgi:ATP-binding cassette subfamily C protein CydD